MFCLWIARLIIISTVTFDSFCAFAVITDKTSRYSVIRWGNSIRVPIKCTLLDCFLVNVVVDCDGVVLSDSKCALNALWKCDSMIDLISWVNRFFFKRDKHNSSTRIVASLEVIHGSVYFHTCSHQYRIDEVNKVSIKERV